MSDDTKATPGPAGVFEAAPARRAWPWLAIAAVLGVGIAIGWGLTRMPAFTAKPAGVSAAADLATAMPDPGPIAVKPETLIDWYESRGPAAPVYIVDGLRISITPVYVAEDLRSASLHVVGPGGAAFDLVGHSSHDKTAISFMVGRLDPDNPTPQVIFTSTSDGLKCCTQAGVLTLTNGTWRQVDLGDWTRDGVGGFPKDLDGDGRPDFAFRDYNFTYAFSEQGEIEGPPVFIDLIGDKAVDVSAKPGLRKAYGPYFDKARKACREGSNAWCAAYAAAAARMGLFDQAWPEILASYDRQSEEALPVACRGQPSDPDCPKDKRVEFATFPESLRWFLGEHGYLPPMPLPPAPGARGPSFNCAKASGEVLQLICADAGLASQDRDLTLLYRRALVLVPDAAGVETGQQAFLRARDAAGPNRDALAALYGQRLAALRRQIGE